MTKPALVNWFKTSIMTKGSTEPPCAVLALLTVIVPSYERQDFLLRQCAYWHGSGVTMLIVDGSVNRLFDNALEAISQLQDIKYYHAPSSYVDRLNLASKHIVTPYAVLMGDDEFLLLDGLRSAIKKLEDDGSLAACNAQSIAFYPGRDGDSCTYGPGYPHWQYSIMQTSTRERLSAALSNYTAATAYAVMRTPAWRRSYGNQRPWTSPYASEMQQAISTYISGGLATVDEVYWMRSDENRPVNIGTFNRGRSFQEWWTSPKLDGEHNAFIEILGAELAHAQGIKRPEADASIREAVEIFVCHMHQIATKASDSPSEKIALASALKSAVVSMLKLLLPERLLQWLKALLFNFRYGSGSGTGTFGNLTELKQLPTPPFLISDALIFDLSNMEKLIAGFYKARQAQSQ